jgi:hypothetical protein
MRLLRKRKRGWSQMPAGAKPAIAGMGMLQLALLARAGWDLIRRPASQVRGPKLLWAPLLFVNFIGPLGYLRFGRKRGLQPEDVGGEEI